MDAKRAVGEAALDWVKDGMVLGLGTGSTIYFTLLALAERIKGGLRVEGVPTSRRTEDLARRLEIPLVPLDASPKIDLAIDGADEISHDLDLIKGGGGALLCEKLVALAAERRLIVAERTKLKEHLGEHALPVEVVRFGWTKTAARIAAIGGAPRLRMTGGDPFVTDEGHFILDCAFGTIAEPAGLERELKLLGGVVESGLFVGLADAVLLGTPDGVELRTRRD